MRYGILGHLELHEGDDSVSIAQGHQRLLLAVLLVHANEAVSNDPPPPTAVRSLHNLVPALRKLLGVATPAHQDLRSPDARDIAEGRPSPADIVTLVRLVPDRRAHPPQARGFDLRDAAVGAAGATGLILLLAGSVLRFRRHRHQLFSIEIQRSL